MCGRYTIRQPFREIAEALNLFVESFDEEMERLTGRYNVAPTQDVPAVLLDAKGERVARAMSWGFVPSFAGAKMNPINARDDRLLSSSMWSAPLKKRRCVLPADGFYEWLKLDAKRKQPILFRRDGDAPFGFAGLYNVAKDGTFSCAHITTEPNEIVRPAHDRMPVMMDAAACARWLDADAEADELYAVLKPFAGKMTATPVSSRVNSPKNEGPANVEPDE